MCSRPCVIEPSESAAQQKSRPIAAADFTLAEIEGSPRETKEEGGDHGR